MSPYSAEECAAYDKVQDACKILLDAGLLPTRILVPLGTYHHLAPWYDTVNAHWLMPEGNLLGKLLGNGLQIIVTSTNPTANFCTAYSEKGMGSFYH